MNNGDQKNDSNSHEASGTKTNAIRNGASRYFVDNSGNSVFDEQYCLHAEVVGSRLYSRVVFFVDPARRLNSRLFIVLVHMSRVWSLLI